MLLTKTTFSLFFLSSLFILVSGCVKEEDTTSKVPYARVEIDINTTIENKFDNPYHHQKYYQNQAGVRYAGYGGVIVTSNADASWLYAYDLCCPYEAPLKNELEVVGVGLKLRCPNCKSEYAIDNGTGRVVSGVATERLKRYIVLKDGSFYRIRN
ncbi:MAG: hypothetical protein RL662_1232 [Bacteroidota bacterium]|jgi:nitrite reductase/ring-hydroxylating ferredoxin subunit